MTIPFERYLNIRMAYGPSFSPDGRRLAFLTNITGVPQVWAVDARGGWPDQLTFGADRVSGAWYSPTDDRLIFACDVGGNENAQLFALDGDGSGERRLTQDDGAMHIFGSWSPDGRQIAFSANRRDRGRYDIYVQNVDVGEAEIVWQNDIPGFVWPVGSSPDGTRLLVFLMHSSMNHDLYEITLSGRTIRHLTPHMGQVRYGWPAYAYSSGGQSIYCACDCEREMCCLMRIDLSDLSLHPATPPDAEVEFLAASPDGRWLAWATNVDGAHTITVCDLRSGGSRQAPGLPLGVVSPADETAPVFSPDGQRLAFSFSTSSRTPDVWVWDLEADTVRPVTHSSHAGIPTTSFVEPELIRYPTYDGRDIPAWFYIDRTWSPTAYAPVVGRSRSLRTPESERRPVVVYIHGGPEGQTQPMLFPILQYLIQRGYAVLAPNVRGSSGYGKTYLNLDNVEKRMDSVADLAHAVYWLQQQPDVDPGRIAVYGGSYGGFMVLSALTTYPDLWAAGVDIVGISNFVTFLENTGAYRRSHREAEYGSLERDRDFLMRISPIHHVDKIRAPLMVIHGANDPRVPMGEAEQIVNALRARSVPVESVVYADEGHGLVRLANKLDAYPKVAAFLDKHLRDHP